MSTINKIRVKGVDYDIQSIADSSLSSSSTNPIQNKIVKSELDKKQDKLVSGNDINIDPETNVISYTGSSSGINDAPSDGKKYVRQDNNWVEEGGGR